MRAPSFVFVTAALGLALGLVTLGCHGSSSPTAPARQNALSLASLSPVEGTTMPYGSTAEVSVRVRYSFASAARGKVGIVVTPAPFGLPIYTDPFFLPLEGEQGEATLHFRIYFGLSEPRDLPKGSRIVVNLTLFPEGVQQSSIGFDAHYQLGS
jgi:hypothetical protein